MHKGMYACINAFMYDICMNSNTHIYKYEKKCMQKLIFNKIKVL